MSGVPSIMFAASAQNHPIPQDAPPLGHDTPPSGIAVPRSTITPTSPSSSRPKGLLKKLLLVSIEEKVFGKNANELSLEDLESYTKALSTLGTNERITRIKDQMAKLVSEIVSKSPPLEVPEKDEIDEILETWYSPSSSEGSVRK